MGRAFGTGARTSIAPVGAGFKPAPTQKGRAAITLVSGRICQPRHCPAAGMTRERFLMLREYRPRMPIVFADSLHPGRHIR
jgi:hypothetical protein